MCLADEDVQRKEDIKTHQERGVKLFKSSLKKYTRQQTVLSKEKDDFPNGTMKKGKSKTGHQPYIHRI